MSNMYYFGYMYWCPKAYDQTLYIKYRHNTVQCKCLHSLWPLVMVFFCLYYEGNIRNFITVQST